LKLRRVRIGFLNDDSLKPGRWRLLSPAEVGRLMKAKKNSPAKSQRRKENF